MDKHSISSYFLCMFFLRNILSFCFVLLLNNGIGQVILTESGVEYEINFEETRIGVNEGVFLGDGLQAEPVLGQLDSDAWIINGLSEGNSLFSDNNISGDYARGISIGGETLGGIYAFKILNNTTLGWQSTAADLSPGEIILKIKNQSGFSIERMELDYRIWINNDQNRSQRLRVYYSLDNSSYFPLPDSDIVSQTIADITPQWNDTTFKHTIEFAEIANNEFLYLKWRITDEAGSGSRDEWAIDDILLKITNNTCLFEPWSVVDSTSSLQSMADFTLLGVDSYYESPSNYASHSPSARMDDNLDNIVSPIISDAFSLKFWIKAQGNSSGSSLIVDGFDGSDWIQLSSINPLPSTGTNYTLQNLNSYSQFRFTYHKVNGNIAIDDIAITCGSCPLAENAPPLNSAITFPIIYCNQSEIAWEDVGAEYYLVLASEKQSIINNPIDHHSYSANSNMEEGELFEDSVYVVYNGSDNSFILNQLKSNSDYSIKVIAYNGLSCEENYSSFPISNTLSTPVCDQCPYLTSALINACSGYCNNYEGFNEYIFLNSAAFSFAADTSNFKVYYKGQATSFLNETMLSNAGLVSQLNAFSNCPTLFIDGLSISEIPMNSTILLCHNSICIEEIDKAAFCQSPVVYVIACDSDDWNPNGELVNSGYLNQNIILDFSAITAACVLSYSYIPNDIPQEDGAFIFFSPLGGSSTTNMLFDNCLNDLGLLPLTWGNIEGLQIENGVQIEWTTLSEVDNMGFVIEKSADGKEFDELGWTDSQGDTPFGHRYSFIDENSTSGVSYYRIKQIDFNANYSYSKIIFLDFEIAIRVYQNSDGLIVDGLGDEVYTIELYSIQGERVFNKESDGNKKSISIELSDIKSGVYIIRIRGKKEIISRKVFLKAK